MAGNGQVIQANLFSGNAESPLPDIESATKSPTLDLNTLKTELEEIACCHVSLKFDKKLDVGVSCRQDDRGFRFRLRPQAFRAKKNAEENLNFMRKIVGFSI